MEYLIERPLIILLIIQHIVIDRFIPNIGINIGL